jgi:hypothetical protein
MQTQVKYIELKLLADRKTMELKSRVYALQCLKIEVWNANNKTNLFILCYTIIHMTHHSCD